jgi:hypothetical protein
MVRPFRPGLLVQSSSLGSALGAPIHRHAPRASTPGIWPLRYPGCQPGHHVPPSRFLPASTVFSTRMSRACCIPKPVMGSPRFRLQGLLLGLPKVVPWSPSPVARFTPFEAFPPPCSRSASPRSLPSCRCLLPDRLQGLAPQSGPLLAVGVAADGSPDAPLGFVSPTVGHAPFRRERVRQ